MYIEYCKFFYFFFIFVNKIERRLTRILGQLMQAWKHWRDGPFLELLDLALRDSYSRDEVKRCLHIGLECIQESPAERPTMPSIVLMLNSYSLSLPSPQRPAFFLHSRTETSMPIKELGSDQSTSNGIPSSVNEASITEVYPR